MGIWDELRLTAGKLFNRNLSDKNEIRCSYDTGLAQMVDAVRSNGGAEKLKEYASDLDRGEKISRILNNIGKFAVDSAVNDSLKSVTGGIPAYKIVKEGSKDLPSSHNSNEIKKPEFTIVMEEMQAKMEKMQEDMNNIKQQSKVSIHSAKGLEPLKELPNEPVKGLTLAKTDPKRVMIRSRL